MDHFFPILLIFPYMGIIPVDKRLQSPQSKWKQVTNVTPVNKSIRTQGDFIPAKGCRQWILLPTTLTFYPRELCLLHWVLSLLSSCIKLQICCLIHAEQLWWQSLNLQEILQLSLITEKQESPQVGGNHLVFPSVLTSWLSTHIPPPGHLGLERAHIIYNISV